jgi:predicted nucleotidyltransferase
MFDLFQIVYILSAMKTTATIPPELALHSDEISSFCRKNHIRKLSLFGSHLHGQARPDSDLDLLAEFEPGHTPGLISLADMTNRLSGMLGTEVDLRTPEDLSRYFRAEVLASAVPCYEQG